MYEARPDPYCYADSDVLRNKAGLTKRDELEAFETAMTLARSQEPLPLGLLSVTHYRAIHRHLFQDVYDWAGRFRTVRLAKGQSAFCYPENIAREMRNLFIWLRQRQYIRERDARQFAREAARFLAELNAIHPFREGNGRTQLTFLAVVAYRAGHPLDFTRLDPARMLDAMIRSFRGDEAPLVAILERLAA
jgi:cell filamentation protein